MLRLVCTGRGFAAVIITDDPVRDKLGVYFFVSPNGLKLCWSETGGPRPKALATRPGSGDVLLTLRRDADDSPKPEGASTPRGGAPARPPR